MHICVRKLTIIVPDNGLSPCRRQAIIWSNAGILLIQTIGTDFGEILSESPIFSFKKMHLKMLCVKWQPFYLSFKVLTHCGLVMHMWSYKLHIWISGQHHYWFRLWLVTNLVPSHYINQVWLTISWNHRTNFNKILIILINQLKMSSAKCQPFCSDLHVYKEVYFLHLTTPDHSQLDSFTVPLHSPNGRPACR